MATKPSTGSLRPKTSGPELVNGSSTTSVPKRYSLFAPSTKPIPATSTCAVLPSPATLSISTSTITGRICKGKVPSVKSVRVEPTSE